MEDNALLVSAGEPFLIDYVAARRKLRQERIALLKHRVGVLWKHFGGFVVWPIMVIAGVAAVVSYIWAWSMGLQLLVAYTGWAPDLLMGVAIPLIIVSHIGAAIGGPTVYEDLRVKCRQMKRDWNPPTILDKARDTSYTPMNQKQRDKLGRYLSYPEVYYYTDIQNKLNVIGSTNESE